ncbi:hypothetical protein AC249_AIPGENE8820 [Exaiptasia diaphana]|nr:hypothetical protein AC249_AIPGENE8820 [Exaiptasia diaphana]
MNWSTQSLLFISFLKFYQVSCIFERERDGQYDFYPGRLSVLPVSAEQKSVQVVDKFDCVFSCTENNWCKSVNFRKSPLQSGLHACELLSLDFYTNRENITQDSRYNHYSVKTSLDVTIKNQLSCSLKEEVKTKHSL